MHVIDNGLLTHETAVWVLGAIIKSPEGIPISILTKAGFETVSIIKDDSFKDLQTETSTDHEF